MGWTTFKYFYRSESDWNPNSITLKHDRPAACVINQQYSSPMFASWRFHSRKENFGAFQQFYYRNFFLTFLRLGKSAVKSGIVRTLGI
jgi:uncharacterized protein (DUF608 family)